MTKPKKPPHSTRVLSQRADAYARERGVGRKRVAALAGGVEDARYLVAASIDRYLSFTVGIQRYGTNRLINQSSGTEELVPIDRSVSDAERKLYGVAPLQELLSRYPEQRADSSSSATRRD